MAQGESKDGDVIVEKDGRVFSVEKEIANAVNSLVVDYYKGWLRKGFSVSVNGAGSSC